MSLSTLPKWLKLGLPIFLGVLVVGSILVFSTNPELFQGSLGRIEPVDIRQVSPTFDFGQEEEPAPSFTFEECQLLKQYAAAGTLTDHLGNDLSSYFDCEKKYPEYMHGWPSIPECKTLKQHLTNGNLTSELNGDINYAIYCENAFPSIWHGQDPDENYCWLLHTYYEAGTLTGWLGQDISDATYCADNNPGVWFDEEYNKNYCELLKGYADNGILTEVLNGDISNAIYCSETYPDIWSKKSLSPNYCNLLKGYYDDGILTDMLNGDISDAQFCADNFPTIWYDVEEPKEEQPQPEPPEVDEPKEFEFCEGFVDVPEYHQYYDAVQYMIDAGIVDEHPSECKFRINDFLNRAEASKLMVLGFKLVNPAVSAPHFPDVSVDSWYYDYVSTVFENNVMTGSPDGLFKPGNTLNRAEMVKMVVVAHHGGNTLAVPAITEQAAKDSCPGLSQEELGGWYMPYFVNAKDIGIVPVNDPCRPADPATRGEVSQVFYFENLI